METSASDDGSTSTRQLTASSEAELMETPGMCFQKLGLITAHRFFGSGINGNKASRPWRFVRPAAKLTASSEAELMETSQESTFYTIDTNAHRFFGSGINGNKLPIESRGPELQLSPLLRKRN